MILAAAGKESVTRAMTRVRGGEDIASRAALRMVPATVFSKRARRGGKYPCARQHVPDKDKKAPAGAV